MNFRSLLEEARLDPENPSKSLSDIFIELNFIQRFVESFDGSIGTRLRMIYNKLSEKIDNDDANKFLSILNVALPNRPEDRFDVEYVPAQDRAIEKLAAAVLEPFLFMLYHYAESGEFSMGFFGALMTKALYYASEETLCDEEVIFNARFFNFIGGYLQPACNDILLFVQDVFITFLYRLPKDKAEMIWTQDIAFNVRFIASTKCSGNNRGRERLMKKYYHEHEIEANLGNLVPSWNLLEQACEHFQYGDLSKALATFSEAVDHESFFGQPFMQSEIQVYLHGLLSDSLTYGEYGIKAFIRDFLGVSGEVETPNCERFCNLIDGLIDGLEFKIKNSRNLRKGNKKTKIWARYPTDNDIKVSLNLLHSLYVLNSSWFHWCNFSKSRPLVDDDTFISSELANTVEFLLDSEHKKPQEMLKYTVELVRICPPILSLDERYVLLDDVVIPNPYKNTRPTTFQVSRTNVLRDIESCFKNYSKDVKRMWNFVFENETGIGHGPTKELYTLLSRELQRHDLSLWHADPGTSANFGDNVYTHSPDGLFPKVSEDVPHSVKYFTLFGTIMAKVMLDTHQLNINMSEAFFRRLKTKRNDHLRKNYYDIPLVLPMTSRLVEDIIYVKGKKEEIESDATLSIDDKENKIKSLTFCDGSSFDDLCLNFTVPGSDKELVEGGHDILLSPFNIDEYLQALYEEVLGSKVSIIFEAIKEGFCKVLPLHILDMLEADEIKGSLCSEVPFEAWTVEELESSCGFVEGYQKDSKSVQFLFQVLSSLDEIDRKKFLQFATGTPNLPWGKLAGITPPLTVCKVASDERELRLPSASTCHNVLFLPEYTSLEVTRERLFYALSECGDSFQLV